MNGNFLICACPFDKNEEVATLVYPLIFILFLQYVDYKVTFALFLAWHMTLVSRCSDLWNWPKTTKNNNEMMLKKQNRVLLYWRWSHNLERRQFINNLDIIITEPHSKRSIRISLKASRLTNVAGFLKGISDPYAKFYQLPANGDQYPQLIVGATEV